ncbi:uroporphyrinogen-III synthase [Alicyclobacillus fastidiosus]|uniref:Uroporphyrinogen-III synthase n=1 Tax=Alicyclobacillus fastidiosus TaxID=392011 RepID=A0ABY6ZFI5_9BACL|nr:uroporphyrinogen-III synthase [Alicyclobacillus fastidiosus]WAH41611.1 uroporphyrinogen-III synthase [Alicyclobacillus fastidiosus]
MVAADRRSEEIATLVRKNGGEPLIRSLQGKLYTDETLLERELTTMLASDVDWVIFTTGIGAQKVWQVAERLGQLEELSSFLQRVRVAARGRKTTKFLLEQGIHPDARDDDGTTQGVLRALQPFAMEGLKVCVQLHGELPKSLERWCAQKRESVSFLHAYDYMPPEPVVLEQLVTEVCTGSVDAVAFTSAQQPRFLFRYASQTGADGDLVAGFEKVVAAGVGKVTAEALREHGVTRVVAPEQERMGAMIIELVHYFDGLETAEM